MASFGMCSRLAKIPVYAISAINQSNKICAGNKTRMMQWTRLASALNKDNPGNKPSSEESPETNESKEKDSPLNAQVQELTTRLNELDDKYKRALAETENVRTRMRRQIDDAKTFGIQSFCKDLLEVADVLSKATESVPESELGGNQHLKNLYDGLRMTDAQMQKVFRQHGLVQINPIGEKFDPNMHEALFEQVFEGKVPGTVAVVSKIGYSLHNRTIRPASVGVVKSA